LFVRGGCPELGFRALLRAFLLSRFSRRKSIPGPFSAAIQITTQQISAAVRLRLAPARNVFISPSRRIPISQKFRIQLQTSFRSILLFSVFIPLDYIRIKAFAYHLTSSGVLLGRSVYCWIYHLRPCKQWLLADVLFRT